MVLLLDTEMPGSISNDDISFATSSGKSTVVEVFPPLQLYRARLSDDRN